MLILMGDLVAVLPVRLTAACSSDTPTRVLGPCRH